VVIAMLVAASSDGGTAAGVVFVIIIFGGALYFLPTIVGAVRKVPNLGSVVVINVFLGWSLIGWVVAMAMAARSTPPVHHVNVYNGPPAGMHPGQQPPWGSQAPAQPPRQQSFDAPGGSNTSHIAPAQTGPAGWHPDPHGEKRLRYFDGNAWTAHVAD
jgi:hypothetical protein